MTASKAPLSIGEIAAQVDVVDRSEIDERGDQRLTQAISHVPGVIVSTVAGSFESVMLRGLPRESNEFTSTLLLIDGVPQTDSRNSSRVTPASTDTRGGELGTRWTPTPRVSAYVNAALYRNRFGGFVIEQAGGDTDLTGNRLPISPDRIVNAGVTFTPVPRLAVRVDVKHVGDVMMDRGNTFQLDPYTLLDAAVSWRTGPTRITLSAHNLFNAEYYWNGDWSRAESADPGAPRQLLLTTSFSFR